MASNRGHDPELRYISGILGTLFEQFSGGDIRNLGVNGLAFTSTALE